MWAASGAAQCDLWFPPRQIPSEDGASELLPVLVIVQRTPGSPEGGWAQRVRHRICRWDVVPDQTGRAPRRMIWGP